MAGRVLIVLFSVAVVILFLVVLVDLDLENFIQHKAALMSSFSRLGIVERDQGGLANAEVTDRLTQGFGEFPALIDQGI
jgi:hypothetical protein